MGGGRGGAVLESPLADLEVGALLNLPGVVVPLDFASNIEATADTETGLGSSSSFGPCKPPSTKLVGISTRSKLVEELSASVPGLVSDGTRIVSPIGQTARRDTGHARTVELDIGVGSIGAARLDLYSSSSE